MKKRITLRGIEVGRLEWDLEARTFSFELDGEGSQLGDLHEFLSDVRVKGHILSIFSTEAGDVIAIQQEMIPLSDPEFMSELSWEIGKLGYKLENA